MGARLSHMMDNPYFSHPTEDTDSVVPWKMDTTKMQHPDLKHWRGAQPCELQHPALRHCRQTRMIRDQCTTSNGNCDYKIEAHFQCLEQYYPKQKVDRLRSVFRSNAYDNYQTIDDLLGKAPLYYAGDFNPSFADHTNRI
eukprot:TRINITY_DN3292_c0_g2_i1.p2 TRINITY_DN3292_c0_g2~~TRINITY_DN3292_c0_g2_i1.p2  ORF type:complete len:140 (+),score=42.55 TRINITY_DN3292_c0_g2_i1:73-492(+)